MRKEEIRREVLAQIEVDEQVVDLTGQLVQIPSITGNENAVADFVIDWLTQRGVEVTGIPTEDGRKTVRATVGNLSGPRLLLTDHLDTVGIGNRQVWVHDPFSGIVENGRLYGRGATDSKGGVASVMGALAALQMLESELPGCVEFLATIDSETGGSYGLGHLVDQGLVAADAVIYCSHSDLKIQAYFKGLVWLKLHFPGKPSHAAYPLKGENALEKAARWIAQTAPLLVEGRSHPVLGQATLSTTWLRSGDPEIFNVVPDSCTVGIDARMVPPDALEGFLARLQDVIDPEIEVELMAGYDPHQIGEDEPILDSLKNAYAVATGRSAEIVGHISTGSVLPLIQQGVPALGFGPGHLERCNAHAENEFVETDQLITAAQVYAVTALEFFDLVGLD
jgi:succinyl-diaminopimelate desuccinylase